MGARASAPGAQHILVPEVADRRSGNCREGGHGTDRSGLGMNAKGRDAPELAVPGRPVTANS
jgi:hypothetical protein